MPRDYLKNILTMTRDQFFYVLATILFSILFIDLALHCYFADSEIWLLTLSQKTFSPNLYISVYYKWFFHFITWLTSLGIQDTLAIYRAERFVFALVALFSLFLNARLLSLIYNDKTLILPIFLFGISASLFFNQGFRIRADILALCLQLLFLNVALFVNWRPRLILMPLMILLALTTPKSILFIASDIIFALILLGSSSSELSLRGKNILLSVLIPLVFFLAVLGTLSLVSPHHAALLAIHSALDFYLKSFEVGLGGTQFFRFFDFFYLLRFLRLNPAHTFVFLLWIFLFYRDLFFDQPRSLLSRAFSSSTICLLLSILLYNQKLPFFLGPFLTPVLGYQFAMVFLFFKKKSLTIVSTLLIGIGLFCCFKQYTLNIQQNNNNHQLQFISDLQSYKKQNPTTKIYDIIGLLPKMNDYFLFVGPGEVTHRQWIIKTLEMNKPQIYLYTFKNVFLEPDIKNFLDKNYLEIQPGVWILSRPIQITTTENLSLHQKNKKTFWSFRLPKDAHLFAKTPLQDLSAYCQNTSSALQHCYLPLEVHSVFTTETPLLKTQNSPTDLFRFDTAF